MALLYNTKIKSVLIVNSDRSRGVGNKSIVSLEFNKITQGMPTEAQAPDTGTRTPAPRQKPQKEKVKKGTW